jgi:FMN phosphatase YigB (HAD superfamily)
MGEKISDMHKKEIIFFDGDGTLWYPKETRYTEKPHWIYSTAMSLDGYCEQLMLIPGVLSTLEKMKKLGIITVILSTHPHEPEEAAVIINHKVTHFNLHDLFDEVHATRHFQESKGEFIVNILKKRGFPKNRALMVGDSYRWDYKSARDVGIDALLIESDYLKKDPQGKRVKNTIRRMSDVLSYV